MTYDAAYFIAKFEAIPEDAGPMGRYGDWTVKEILELRHVFGSSQQLEAIKEGKHPRYPQPTPKQRILAALRDVKGAR